MMPIKESHGAVRVWRAIGYSLAGLRAAVSHEAAFRQELALAAVLVPAAFFASPDRIERALLIGAVLLVLVVELLNSALEAAVDRISMERHDLARRAKDIGSAAVFLSIVNAVIVWVLVLWR
ncbi:diacylglycerol kinase [Sulfurifustis variabilis]|uniref:Diacylglycerol kinase n=1 Tax=Sulfurifustis variabilis TaxID=1675686 RepID=A0A1B4V5C6_9GAMM|nr:diacylglycerol kinase [Sulfurifustis variabilis]BAU48739.1 diacylglycerol kinase [Sulfurifustis variabilis]